MLGRLRPSLLRRAFARTLFPISFVMLALSHQAAHACIDFAPFVVSDIRHADAIFTGDVVRYEIVSPEEPGTLQDYGLLTIRVRDQIKGEVSKEIQLYWWNSTFGMPETLFLTDPAIFAAVRSGRTGLPLRSGSATIFPSRRPELMQLMQAPCSSAFMFPYSQKIEADIRTLVSGATIAEEEFGVGDAPGEFREIHAIHRSEGPSKFALTAGALAGGAGLLAALWLWRRQKQKGPRQA